MSGYQDLVAPRNQKEAYKIDKDHWVKAELAELAMLNERQTVGKNVVGSKCTYVVKTNGDGEWYKDKVRFIAQGFTMVAGEDFTETWAAVARLESI